MITTLMLYLILGIVEGILSAMKFLGFAPVTAFGTAGGVNGFISVLFAILPITMSSVITGITAVMAFAFFYGLYLAIKWGYSKIPGIN